jgi:hypothetical protein
MTESNEHTGPRFALGQIVATPGEVPPEDARENELSVREGFRVLSSYGKGEARLWIITEADRAVTTVLRPEDY